MVCVSRRDRKGGCILDKLLAWLEKLWTLYILKPIEHFTIWDGLDIFLLSVLFYCVYLFFRGRRAGKLAVGAALIFLLYAISNMADLRAIHRILSGIASFAVILVAIIFQNDIRDALEKLGGILSPGHRNRADLTHTVNEVVDAACQIAMSEGDGALIVIECTTGLSEYVENGHPIDAVVTSALLRNIFVNRTPLHDGAVIIRHNRIASACSKLPLSVNERVVRNLGTRHRAGVGITEVSDCVVVVVSEERNIISIANNGVLKRTYNTNAEELHNEATLKNTQNLLREDLFRLLVDMNFEQSAEAEKSRKAQKKPGFYFRFKWKRSDKDQDASQQ